MKIVSVVQGSEQWHELRATKNTASNAAALFGAHKYKSRNDLLLERSGAVVDAVTPEQQRLFDKGHAAEATARQILQKQIGNDLFPTVCVEGNLLASLDGATLLGEVIFEHKLWNEELAQQVKSGDLDPHYYWQLEHQLYVTGADAAIFVCSDGTSEKWVQMEYLPVEGRAEKLLMAWQEFDKDLENFKPNAVVEKPKGKKVEDLPALQINLVGEVKDSNLEAFKEAAEEMISKSNTDLVTDQDFADAEVEVKACKKTEDNIKMAKGRALEQTASIKALFDTMDEVSEMFRQHRLGLNKKVTSEKENRRRSIANKRQRKHASFLLELQSEIEVDLTFPGIDALGAMRGLKTIKSMEDAADQALADGKLAAQEIAAAAKENIKFLNTGFAEFKFLFSDLPFIVGKQPEDFQATVEARIARHKAAEEQRQQEEAEKANAVTEATPEPAPKPVAKAKTKKGAKPVRPTDREIVQTLAAHYGVDAGTVCDWICEIDLSELSDAA